VLVSCPDNVGTDNLQDSKTIIVTGLIHDVCASACDPANHGLEPFVLSEITGRTSSTLLNVAQLQQKLRRDSVPAETIRTSPGFCSGRTFSSKQLSGAFIAEAFMKHYLFAVINSLLNGQSDVDHPRKIVQQKIPTDAFRDDAELSFHELFKHMLMTDGLLVLALYRAAGEENGSLLPYVVTNPDANTLVLRSDGVIGITGRPRHGGDLHIRQERGHRHPRQGTDGHSPLEAVRGDLVLREHPTTNNNPQAAVRYKEFEKTVLSPARPGAPKGSSACL